MSFSTEIGWEEFSITNKGAEAAEAMAKSFLDKVFPQWAGNPILTGAIKAGQAAGFALNPETLVLFKGIDLRTFSYTFFFSPKNEREAKSIRDIIKAFRFHAAPEINKDFGLFYIAPSTFDIDFMHRGRRNTNIHQVKTCVLTHYDVDYAPFGWSTHKDGMPIQTKLNLVFKEVEMLDKGEIENGY
jgi:hypothetical protein